MSVRLTFLFYYLINSQLIAALEESDHGRAKSSQKQINPLNGQRKLKSLMYNDRLKIYVCNSEGFLVRMVNVLRFDTKQ